MCRLQRVILTSSPPFAVGLSKRPGQSAYTLTPRTPRTRLPAPPVRFYAAPAPRARVRGGVGSGWKSLPPSRPAPRARVRGGVEALSIWILLLLLPSSRCIISIAACTVCTDRRRRIRSMLLYQVATAPAHIFRRLRLIARFRTVIDLPPIRPRAPI